MAVAYLMQFSSVTPEQYDAVMQELNLGSKPPKGALLHMAGPTEDGWRVIDVWESPEVFDAFVQTRLGQALHNAGISEQPAITSWPIHGLLK
ncbi:MAG: hypothetical protein IT324_01025 [Anaerolineae bacterium]|nr:hypothetical protein [Anaerolineae bacterium]